MAGILDLVSPEDMMTPQVGKNPMQAFNDHIAFNQFLRDQGNLSREDYNILGGYDVANRVSPGNPVVGALGNLFGGGTYNLIENFFSKTGTENSPFINDDGSSYNFRTNVTGQPLSEIPETIFRNALGGSGLIMARKSALEKIEYHEKICRIMQRQTFEQIQQLKNQIIRIERILIGTAAFVIISLLEKII
jgi:hypothetical protein